MFLSQGKKSTAVFLVSMSLVLTLALGVYVSNRMITAWMLERDLEQAFTHKQQAFEDALRTASKSKSQDTAIQGLRLSANANQEETSTTTKLDALMLQKMGLPRILAARTIMPRASSQEQNLKPIFSWNWNSSRGSAKYEKLIAEAQTANAKLTAKPTVNLLGEFGNTATLVFAPFQSNENLPSLVLIVSQAETLQSIASAVTSISIGIGTLCFASILFACALLWLRFHDQVRANKNIKYLAHNDALTGLPNRSVFNARLTVALRLSQAKASNIGVMLIDLDKFKEINDTYGHGAGDIFLQIAADRMRSVFQGHLVSRLSGDEFAVLLTSISDPAQLTHLANEMIKATKAPCLIDGKEINMSFSIGIARATDASWRSSRLLYCADLALYRAKHSGRSTFSWYTPSLDAEAQKRKEVEGGLVKAMKFGQFKLLYQPQYRLRDGSLTGYEALIRWDHPKKGEIKPDIFIPVAEDTGLIEEIGAWVLEHACKEAATWSDQTRRLAVNVSPAQFTAGETQKRVAHALQSSGLDPRRLEIEVTESLLIADTDGVIETLRQIRQMGVMVAMDDFGTGYSSLSYLSLFPFDKIKIDKSFIQNLGKDASTDAIVTSIVGLGRSLDVTITAEGVETQDQAVLLTAAGCDLAQGYLFGRPDFVEKHEAAYPILPLNENGGRWFPQQTHFKRAVDMDHRQPQQIPTAPRAKTA